jgi:hypothetical protein
MIQTNKLRFVERVITTPIDKDVATTKTVKILQQWWADFHTQRDGRFGTYEIELPGGEWRDVPIGEE